MKLQESTDADRSMLDITVTSKSFGKLLSNLKNPHKAAGPEQIKPIIIKKPYYSTITNPKTSIPKVARPRLTPSPLFISAILILLQLDVHMSRSQAGI